MDRSIPRAGEPNIVQVFERLSTNPQSVTDGHRGVYTARLQSQTWSRLDICPIRPLSS